MPEASDKTAVAKNHRARQVVGDQDCLAGWAGQAAGVWLRDAGQIWSPGRLACGQRRAAMASAPRTGWKIGERSRRLQSGPSARRGANQGNARHTSNVNLGRQGGAEPYWRRRVLVLTGVIGVIGLLAWSCSPQAPGPKPPRQAPAAATSSAVQPTVTRPTVTRPATPRPSTSRPTASRAAPTPARSAAKARQTTRKRADIRAHPQGSGCTPGDVVITLLESQQSYQQPAEPRFTIYVVNTGGRTCTFDAGPRSLRLVVESGPVHEWSPADCARRANSDIVRLTHGVPFAEHISWSRMRSDPGCRLPQQAALPGTYTATVTYGAAHSRTEVFLLH